MNDFLNNIFWQNLSMQNIWLNVYKPENISSARAVAIVKRYTKAKKVGHGGTLDVLACGVLPVALNKATKTTQNIMDAKKKYFFRIKWGISTASDDAEGEIISASQNRPKTSQIIASMPDFVGSIKQIPSKFSAIKINGQRAYDLARKGVDFEMKSREIVIFSLKMLENNENYADFEAKCSKGTYIRTLSSDICKKLGVDGHIIRLERLEVGDFNIKNSINLEKFKFYLDK